MQSRSKWLISLFLIASVVMIYHIIYTFHIIFSFVTLIVWILHLVCIMCTASDLVFRRQRVAELVDLIRHALTAKNGSDHVETGQEETDEKGSTDVRPSELRMWETERTQISKREQLLRTWAKYVYPIIGVVFMTLAMTFDCAGMPDSSISHTRGSILVDVLFLDQDYLDKWFTLVFFLLDSYFLYQGLDWIFFPLSTKSQ